MQNKKLSLADLMTVLTSLVFGFICFMGANFRNVDSKNVWGLPNTLGCIIMATAMTLLLFCTAIGAKLLKRTQRNFRVCFIWEGIFLVLFVLFAILFTTKISPFTHFFTVTYQRDQIKDKLSTSINQAEDMFNAYENYVDHRKEDYKRKLQDAFKIYPTDSAVLDSYNLKHSSERSDSSQIEAKMFEVNADLFPSNYSDSSTGNGMKEIAIEWLNHAKKESTGWKPIGIVGVINEIQKKSNEWLDSLVQLSNAQETNEHPEEFNYNLMFQDIKSDLVSTKGQTWLTFLIAILFYMLMLFSWFITRRSSRAAGALSTKPYEVIL